jgi:hypothetical protein
MYGRSVAVGQWARSATFGRSALSSNFLRSGRSLRRVYGDAQSK